MADLWASLAGLLSNPFVAATISGIVSGLVLLVIGYVIGRRSRRGEKKLQHSVILKDQVLLPWSKALISRQSWPPDPDYGCPRLVTDPFDLREEAAFQWAVAHIEGAYPDIWKAWLAVEPAINLETKKVEALKEQIWAVLGDAVQRQYATLVRRTRSDSRDSGSVYFEDIMTSIVVAELWLATTPNHPLPKFSVTTGETSSPPTGIRIVLNTQDVGRLMQVPSMAEAADWAGFIQSALKDPRVQDTFREVVQKHASAEAALRLFGEDLRGLIQKIEHGIAIQGQCAIERAL